MKIFAILLFILSGWAYAGEEEIELSLINSKRAQKLIRDERADVAAWGHSKDMCDRSYFSHTSPDGKSAGNRLTKQGVRWRTWGENIFYGTGSLANAQSAFKTWWNSPGHKANMMNPKFTKIGVGICYCPKTRRTYHTNVFFAEQSLGKNQQQTKKQLKQK